MAAGGVLWALGFLRSLSITGSQMGAAASADEAAAAFFSVLPLQFGSLARDLVVIVMGTGVGLGIVGSWLSVRTYLIR